MIRIYVIGMPGAGKTHFGRQLAQSLGLHFKDLDDMIEKSEGRYIRQIIEEKGEPYFRELERDMLRSTGKMHSHVVSCGGGSPVHHGNMEWMKMNGIVLWLNTDLDVVAKRIAQNITRRPMFMGLNDAEIRVKLRELYEKRRKTYAKSDVQVDVNVKQTNVLAVVIQRVMKAVQRKRL